MAEMIAKSIGYILLIVLGYLLRKAGIFTLEDKNVLGKILMYITLPCAFIANFQNFIADRSLFYFIMTGLIVNVIMMMTGGMMARKRSADMKALYMIDSSGYNIGAFTTPVVSAYLPGEAVIIASMFDIGNCIISVGSIYPIAKRITDLDGKSEKPILYIVKKLFQSVPFDTYLIMLVISLLGVKLPKLVNVVAGQIGAPSIIITMIMIGITFEVQISKRDLKDIVIILATRYLMAAVFMGVFMIMPFDSMVRKVLIICVFAPVTSISPNYCNMCGCRSSVYGAVSSLTVPISLICFIMLVQYL